MQVEPATSLRSSGARQLWRSTKLGWACGIESSTTGAKRWTEIAHFASRAPEAVFASTLEEARLHLDLQLNVGNHKERHNPSKLSSVDDLLHKFQGREGTLYKSAILRQALSEMKHRLAVAAPACLHDLRS